MQYRKNFNMSRGPFGSFTGVIITVLFFLALFYIARFVFKLLWWVAPVLLIVTLIMDYKVVLGYVQWIGKLLKRNPLFGIGAIILSLLCFPVVVAFLFGKAMFRKKVREVREQQQGKFIEYEELPEEDSLELPEVEQPRRKKGDEYDNLFE